MKAYWIGHMTITDPERYKDYIQANAAPFAQYGARFLVRGGAFEAREGEARTRHVVIEFPSLDAARACYDSPGYQTALAIRREAAQGELVIVEGYDRRQPGTS